MLWRFYRFRPRSQPILRVMKNAPKGILLIAGLTLSLLTACSGGFSASPYSFDLALDPSPLGWTITPAGEYVIPSHILTFNSTAGSVGATIEGYTIEYLDSSGNPAFPGDSVQRSRGTLNVRVPPGIRCPPFDATEVDECTVNTDGVVFARSEPASSAPTFMLSIDIAVQLERLIQIGGAVGATANVTFYGTDDVQRRFISDAYEFAISSPVGI